jgi:plasmid stabilization system protein ParE
VTARRNVRFATAAANDLRRLLDYIIETHGLPRTAHEYVDRITDRCEKLADTPLVGTSHDAVRQGLRTLPFEGVVIAFEVGARTVRIRRIYGAAQNYRSKLRGN